MALLELQEKFKPVRNLSQDELDMTWVELKRGMYKYILVDKLFSIDIYLQKKLKYKDLIECIRNADGCARIYITPELKISVIIENYLYWNEYTVEHYKIEGCDKSKFEQMYPDVLTVEVLGHTLIRDTSIVVSIETGDVLGQLTKTDYGIFVDAVLTMDNVVYLNDHSVKFNLPFNKTIIEKFMNADYNEYVHLMNQPMATSLLSKSELELIHKSCGIKFRSHYDIWASNVVRTIPSTTHQEFCQYISKIRRGGVKEMNAFPNGFLTLDSFDSLIKDRILDIKKEYRGKKTPDSIRSLIEF